MFCSPIDNKLFSILAFKPSFCGLMCYLCIFTTFAAGVIIFICIFPLHRDMLIKMHAIVTTLINLRAVVMRHINNLAEQVADQEIYAILRSEVLNRCYFCPASSDKCKGCFSGEQRLCTNNWTSIFSSFCPGCRNSKFCWAFLPFETAQDRWLNVWVLNYISLLTLNAD